MLTNESASPMPARKMPFVTMLPCTEPHGNGAHGRYPLSVLCQPTHGTPAVKGKLPEAGCPCCFVCS